MINLIVYLNKRHNATTLVQQLLEKRLIANGSIDEDNNAQILNNNAMEKQVNCVITMQTQALLFTEIATYIQEQFGNEIAMYATPIVASNDFFDDMIRSKTKQMPSPSPE
jgi:uncharacterized protein involved in tolerance to divalent cations